MDTKPVTYTCSTCDHAVTLDVPVDDPRVVMVAVFCNCGQSGEGGPAMSPSAPEWQRAWPEEKRHYDFEEALPEASA